MSRRDAGTVRVIPTFIKTIQIVPLKLNIVDKPVSATIRNLLIYHFEPIVGTF